MRSRVWARTGGMTLGGLASLLVLSLISIPTLPSSLTLKSAESASPSQCVACHTDAAKLKALTPPDPPAAEAGEG
jgi:mono/diheme cytochrome c family protein